MRCFRTGDTDDRAAHGWPGEQPGERDLGHRHAAGGGDLGHHVNHLLIRVGRSGVETTNAIGTGFYTDIRTGDTAALLEHFPPLVAGGKYSVSGVLGVDCQGITTTRLPAGARQLPTATG